MSRRQISFAESALADLDAIVAWYSSEGVPEVGERLLAEIFQRIEALVDHPELGRQVPEFAQPSLRELIVAPFRVVYRYDEGMSPERIRVVRVWRGERLMELPSDRADSSE